MELGAIATPDKAAPGGFTVIPNVSLVPRYEAMMVAALAVDTVPAVMMKVAELDPWPIITCGKTCAAGLEDEIAIVAPPLPAADVSDTVQVELKVGLIPTGRQESPFNPGVC
jgi:hypothetical protein